MENIEATSVVNEPSAIGLGVVTIVAYTTVGLAMYGAFTMGKNVGKWISRRYHKHKLNKQLANATAAENK